MGQDLVPLAPQVYLFPRDETPNTVQPNVGLIVAGEQTILIDCGNSPQRAREILWAASALSLPPVQTVIYTHHHWDHIFGATTLEPEQVIAHASTAHAMQEYQNRVWGTGQLREEMLHNPALQVRNQAMMHAVRDWRNFHIVRPTITFRSAMALYLDGVHLELQYVGGRHATDSIVVKLPQQRVMFLGDCYYPPPFHLRDEGDIDLDLDMLERLLVEEYESYIDGHGAPYSRAAFAAMIQVERCRQQGES